MAATKPRLGFIGAGRVARALAVGLARAGCPEIVVASRNRASAHALTAAAPEIRAVATAQEAVDAADIVFITTPDAAIEAVVRGLHWAPGKSVVHTSGAESRQVLNSAAAAGVQTASLHPLQTIAAGPGETNLAGVTFALEADEPLKSVLLRIVADLGGHAVELKPEDRPLYHAAAVLVSNYVVTLAMLAADLSAVFGQERSEALNALLPLLQGTVTNLVATGLPGALTGPIERGDLATVERHLDALANFAPGVLATYRALGSQTIPIAIEKGSIDQVTAEGLQALLGGIGDACALGGVETRATEIEQQRLLEASG